MSLGKEIKFETKYNEFNKFNDKEELRNDRFYVYHMTIKQL